MAFLTLALGITLSLLVAINAQLHVRPRQAPSSPVPALSPAPGPSVSAGAPPASATGSVVSGSVTLNVTSFSPPPTFPITIASTNPTAIPIDSLTYNATLQATVPLDATYPAGAQPTLINGAPSLPDISRLNPANYPHLDRPPPTDSPLVQQWIQEVKNTGFSIPDYSPNQPGGCPANREAARDPSRCWWTCNQCSRSTDIISCPDKFTWGSSFDDGPANYTPNLIQYLNEQKLKTTFFVVGSRVISRPASLQSQYIEGHQISVHTWSHTPLTTQSNDAIIAELGWSKKVIKDVLGVTPNTMRPPFGDIDDRVRAISAAMGLTPIIWTSGMASNGVSFDTKDFDIGAGLISASGVVNQFSNILRKASQIGTGFIVLEHDLFEQSIDIATGYIIPEALAQNFKLMPIVQCLKKPLSDAYIETNDNVSNPRPSMSGASIVGGAATTLPTVGAKNGSGALVVPFPPVGVWGIITVLLCVFLGTVTVFR